MLTDSLSKIPMLTLQILTVKYKQLSGPGSYFVLFSSQTFSITLNTNHSGQFGRTNEGIWNEDRLQML